MGEKKVGASVRLIADRTHSWLIVKEVQGIRNLRRFRIRNPHGHERNVFEDEIEVVEAQ